MPKKKTTQPQKKPEVVEGELEELPSVDRREELLKKFKGSRYKKRKDKEEERGLARIEKSMIAVAPPQRRVMRLRIALLEAVTPEQFKRIAQKVADEAEAGNIKAAQLLFDRVLGKAVQPIEAFMNVNDETSTGESPYAKKIEELKNDPEFVELALQLERKLHESSGPSRDGDSEPGSVAKISAPKPPSVS